MVNQDPYLKERLGEVGIFTSDKYTKFPVKTENDLQTLTLENKGSKNKLTIEATNATINLGTPNNHINQNQLFTWSSWFYSYSSFDYKSRDLVP